ncbi:MAG: phosphoribosylamine--glycine ligase [Bacteroidia bacterium]
MRILILGSGGRECTFAWKLAQEIPKENIFIAPGNAGTSDYGTNVELSILDFQAVAKFCIQNNIDTLLPGGEDTLVAGIRNYFEGNEILKHIYVFGPDKTGALLEGSKEFAKKFMAKNNIPTAKYQSFVKGDEQQAKDFLKTMKPPYVIKADGLAAGKGVVIPETLFEAESCVDEMLGGQFGNASSTIVIEEFLKGIEVSFFAITDGKDYILLPEAKDYKRIGENDTGLNTGGMGAVSPVLFVDENFKNKVIEQVVKPTMTGLQNETFGYRGFVFFGLINVEGNPFVIEYNCRMGDPETEVVLPRLKNSFSETIDKARDGTFSEIVPQLNERFCTTVMLVSGGYPGDYSKGKNIKIGKITESIVFHAGTKIINSQLQTAGGRVIAVSSFGNTMTDALAKSYESINNITFEGMYYRGDIGRDLL